MIHQLKTNKIFHGFLRRTVLILTLIFLFAFQSDQFVFKQSILIQNDFISCDNIGNVYVVKGDAITKLNTSGKVIRTYSNKKLGKIFHVDASNPLRILVFYKDFSLIVFLDSQLTQNGESIQLENMNLEQSDLACSSFNNGAWVFSRQNAELIRVDENLISVIRTGNLNRLMNVKLEPLYLLEHNGFVYLSDKSEGILRFDIYGNYSKTISLRNIKSFQVFEDRLFAYKQDTIISHHFLSIQRDTFLLPLKNAQQSLLTNSGMYLAYRDSIVFFEKK